MSKPLDYRYTAAAWAEVFTILAKYHTADEWFNVCAEHDQIWVGPEDAEKVSAEDRVRLEELGWTPADEGGFTRFV